MKNFSIILDEGNKIKVIPSKWLTDDKKAIFWPPFKKLHDINEAVIHRKDISKDWKKFLIQKYIESNDNYEDAVKESKSIDFDQVKDTSNGDIFNKRRNKRSHTPHDIALELSKKQKINSKTDNSKKSTPAKIIPSESEESGIDEIEQSSKTTSPKNNNESTYTEAPSSLNLTKDNAVLTENHDHPDSEAPSTSQTTKELDIQNLSERELMVTIYGVVEKILKKVNLNSVKINKLQEVTLRVQQKNVLTDGVALSLDEISEISKYFPIDNIEENTDKKMEVVEKKFKEKNKVFFNNVARFFKNKGGHDLKKLVYNIMSAAMTNEVANLYSYTGRKTPKLAFKELYLCSCVFRACQLVFRDADDDSMKGAISAWLDTANTRLQREAKSVQKKRVPFQPLDINPIDDEDYEGFEDVE